MNRLFTIRILGLAFALIFLLSQGLASAHLVDHGCEDHPNGDDAPCAVTILGEDETDLDGPPEVETVRIEETPEPVLTPTAQDPLQSPNPSRAPPPRAPPH